GDDHGDTGGGRPADGGVERVAVAVAAVPVVGALATEAQVDDLDVVGGGILGHPVQPADHARHAPRPVRPEDPHGVQRRAGGHADHAGDPLVGHDAGHVGPVAVVVGRAAAPAPPGVGGAVVGRGAVVAADHVE